MGGRRQQAQNTTTRVPDWIQLYEVLVELEKEIEELLPEFQELVLGLQYVSAFTAFHTHSNCDLIIHRC